MEGTEAFEERLAAALKAYRAPKEGAGPDVAGPSDATIRYYVARIRSVVNMWLKRAADAPIKSVDDLWQLVYAEDICAAITSRPVGARLKEAELNCCALAMRAWPDWNADQAPQALSATLMYKDARRALTARIQTAGGDTTTLKSFTNGQVATTFFILDDWCSHMVEDSADRAIAVTSTAINLVVATALLHLWLSMEATDIDAFMNLVATPPLKPLPEEPRWSVVDGAVVLVGVNGAKYAWKGDAPGVPPCWFDPVKHIKLLQTAAYGTVLFCGVFGTVPGRRPLTAAAVSAIMLQPLSRRVAWPQPPPPADVPTAAMTPAQLLGVAQDWRARAEGCVSLAGMLAWLRTTTVSGGVWPQPPAPRARLAVGLERERNLAAEAGVARGYVSDAVRLREKKIEGATVPLDAVDTAAVAMHGTLVAAARAAADERREAETPHRVDTWHLAKAIAHLTNAVMGSAVLRDQMVGGVDCARASLVRAVAVGGVAPADLPPFYLAPKPKPALAKLEALEERVDALEPFVRALPPPPPPPPMEPLAPMHSETALSVAAALLVSPPEASPPPTAGSKRGRATTDHHKVAAASGSRTVRAKRT